MDLDNIKKTWRETEIKPAIDNEKIQKMISNEGQSAFEKLLCYEKLGMWVMIPCIPLLGVLYWKDEYIPVFIMIIFGCLCGISQIYKFLFLKKTDVMNMNILEISLHMNKYKVYIYAELIVGIIFLSVIFALPVFYTPKVSEYSADTIYMIRFVAGLGIGIPGIYILYKFTYLKNIRKLEASIKEVQGFEKDNR
ncbi:MAG: hypothetical protein LBR26_06605 [Prevotella sp.]|jgi:hypothetical protein|nr:hypothetical protein [Prevotella sp.]